MTLRVPKLGNCLEMYTCAQASAQSACCMSCVQAWTLLAHWSYCLDTPCTLELLLGHSLYTTQVLLGHSLYTRATAWALLVHYTGTAWTLLVHAWAFLVHYTGTAWILLVHYTGTTWVLLVHIQYNDLGTLSTLQGYCFGTPGTLQLHAWVFLANKLPLACPLLVNYLKSYTCALQYKTV